jgi:hypothetical protein
MTIRQEEQENEQKKESYQFRNKIVLHNEYVRAAKVMIVCKLAEPASGYIKRLTAERFLMPRSSSAWQELTKEPPKGRPS